MAAYTPGLPLCQITVMCTSVLLMTLDLVGCPQALNSPICPLDVADSLSTQQVLSGLSLSHWPTLMKTQTVCLVFSGQACWHRVNPLQPTVCVHNHEHMQTSNKQHTCRPFSTVRAQTLYPQIKNKHACTQTNPHNWYLNMPQLALSGCTNTMTPTIWPVTYCSSLGLKETAHQGQAVTHRHILVKKATTQMAWITYSTSLVIFVCQGVQKTNYENE